MNSEVPLEIFWISGSPYSWRVLLALAIKQVPFESHLLSEAKNEHKSEAYLKVNARGKVPGLRHGELTMGESVSILRYIERCFPRPPLFGESAVQEARINQQIDEIENYLVPHSHSLTLAVFEDRVTGHEEVFNAYAESIRAELTDLNEKVNTWLAGDTLSAADIVLYPVIAGLLRAAGKPSARTLELELLPFADRYSQLSEWCKRIEGLPGYDATYPPHWREP